MYSKNHASNIYQNVSIESIVAGANRHELISILFKDLSTSLTMWQYYFENNNIAEKGECINKATKILIGLQSCLDTETGGDIAINLYDLYGYCIRTVFRANARNDVSKVIEVKNIISEIQSAWENIPSDFHNMNSTAKAM
jgi:flagellar protein FliS